MIASLSGKLQTRQAASAVIDVGGVGYEVQVSARTCDALPAVGEEAFLLVHTHVREDAITLYGFTSPEEKEFFLLLNSVSGIGPRLALAILSGIGVSELGQAIGSRDLARLTTISGVGKKTAQRLCMELADKVGAIGLSEGADTVPSGVEPVSEGFAMQDAVSALVNLGYPRATAWQAIRAIQKNDPEAAAAMSVEELLRLALQAMAR